MATKRRKVWVNEWAADEDGPASLGPFVWQTKAAALSDRASNGTVVPMVERLPGDVVLSREQADLICRRLNDLYDVTVQNKHEIRALLRGRR